MQAVLFDVPGGPETLYLGRHTKPVAGAGELLVYVHATALNRADLLQRQGKYPPPPGESPILGLEMAGTVMEVGPDVEGFEPGDRVCALLGGGGYAQFASIPASLALRLPGNMSFTRAAAVPEAFLTAFQALHLLAELQAGERVLIHAGASGVGVAALQLARLAGAGAVLATASAAKHDFCRQVGAQQVFDYKDPHWPQQLMEATGGHGVDVIVDFVGAPYFAHNLSVMADEGRMAMLGFLGGSKLDGVDLAPILRKRLRIMGSTLRARSLEYKTTLTEAFRRQCWPAFAAGELFPVVDSIYDWNDVAAAHRYMEGNHNQGKIVMSIG
jgi:putative PIG3 family NAD(P)H quinone oxidoreductase